MQHNAKINTETRGFSLIELAIVLGVLGLLLGGLFQLTASSSRTIQDQVTAQQIQQYVRATKAYLASRMQVTPGTPATVTIGIAPEVILTPAVNSVTDITARVQAFRAGLSVLSPQDSTFQVRIRRMADIATVTGNEPMFAIGIFLNGGNPIQRAQMGSIATLVGAEGAAVYDGATFGEGDIPATGGCNEAGVTIRSSFGSSCINGTFMDGGLGVPAAERAAALTYGSPSDFTSSVSQWLSRVAVAGAPQLTTMSTNLTMGGTGAAPGNDIIMTDAQNDITMNGGTLSDTAGSLNVNDTLNIQGGGNLTMNGGSISDATAGPLLLNDDVQILAGRSLNINGSITGGVVGINFNNGAASIPLLAGSVGAENNLDVTGSLSVSGSLRAAQFVYSSDERLKKDIRPVDNALQKLENIRGVSFTYKKDNRESYGVIAQDVEKVFPQLIANDAKGFKMVEYTGLIGPMIEAMHELADENAKLRARIEKLEEKKAKQ